MPIKKIEKKAEEKILQLKQESVRIKQQTSRQAVGYILTALGLVAGLAWNDAIKAFIEYAFPLGQGTITARFIYAAVITVMVVVISTYLLRVTGEEKQEKGGR